MNPQQAASRKRGECPRCLPGTARIATPRGDVAVAALLAGDPVWTVDENGARVEGTVLYVESSIAPPGHKLLQAVLTDGRRVAASAGHPVRGGMPLGHLRAGDLLDGSPIQTLETVDLPGSRTFDLMPSGPTHIYWADGVVLESTLQSR
jgi:hypothetical protein